MSLLLVNPPTLHWVRGMGLEGRASYLDVVLKSIGGIQNARHFPIEHLGLLSIKAYGAAQGIPVGCINAISEFHRSEEETFDAIRRTANRLGVPTLIGLSGPNLVFNENLWIARRCKQEWPDVKIILGHDFATLNFERILLHYPEIDFISRGDGERVFCELGQALEKGAPVPENLPGLVSLSEGKIRANAPQPPDIDNLPLPHRDDLARALYHGFGVSISTSRGCPFRCTYCTTGQTAALLKGADSYRLRSIDLVLEEVEGLYRDHHVRHFVITDDLFLTSSESSRARVEAFANGIVARHLDISFMFDCRVDSIDIPLFKRLYQAGLREIFVGVETGSDEQRARYNKTFVGKRDSGQILADVRDLGVRIIPGILTFHPEITTEELRATLSLIEKVGSSNMYNFINRVIPYPGTPLYEDYRRQGLLDPEWPVAKFKFKDPRMEDLFETMLRSVSEPAMNFQNMKDRFSLILSHLEEGVGLSADGASLAVSS